MAVRLNDLCDRMGKLGVKLIAGSAGLARTVRWIHMVESVEETEFLDGQELACMTGIGVSQGGAEALTELVRVCAEAGASGVLINIGPYVESIPDEVVSYCDERSLPLFCAPWRVHLARVMHMVSLTVARADQEHLELAAALSNALFKPDQESLYLDQLHRAGYQREWNYCVSVLDPELPAAAYRDGADTEPEIPGAEIEVAVSPALDAPVSGMESPTETALRRVRNTADDIATLYRWRMTAFALEKRVILVFANYQLDQVLSMTREVIAGALKRLSDGARVFCGVGKVTKSARCIGKSYGQAERIAHLQRVRNLADVPRPYDTMGADRLLVSVEDPAILQEFVDGGIGRLAAYDETHNAGLVEVLETYLASNGSLQHTADALFVHRNTVSYKLNKISALLDVDLSDFETRVELYLGLKARELCGC